MFVSGVAMYKMWNEKYTLLLWYFQLGYTLILLFRITDKILSPRKMREGGKRTNQLSMITIRFHQIRL